MLTELDLKNLRVLKIQGREFWRCIDKTSNQKITIRKNMIEFVKVPKTFEILKKWDIPCALCAPISGDVIDISIPD